MRLLLHKYNFREDQFVNAQFKILIYVILIYGQSSPWKYDTSERKHKNRWRKAMGNQFFNLKTKILLYNLQILTLFSPINFLRLQLQNNSAVGVEVNPEAYSCALCFEIKKFGCLTLGMIY